MSFSDRWTVRAPADEETGSRDVVALLRRAADYIEALGPVCVTDLVLRREPSDGGEALALTASLDHARLPTDLDYLDPRMAASFDDGDERRDDFDFMLALAADVGAQTIVDVGCGTARLATYLAAGGRQMIGIDPAPAMIDVARTRPGAERIEWRIGDVGVLGTPNADLVVMTGNVAGYIVEDSAWDEALRAIRVALRPGGCLAFGSRNPEARAWERWTTRSSWSCSCRGSGEAARHELEPSESEEGGMEVVTVQDGRVRVDGYIVFADTGELIVAGSEYRFRTLDELADSLTKAGFSVEHIYGGWLREPLSNSSEDIVLVARLG